MSSAAVTSLSGEDEIERMAQWARGTPLTVTDSARLIASASAPCWSAIESTMALSRAVVSAALLLL